jgi:hypothetical protein
MIDKIDKYLNESSKVSTQALGLIGERNKKISKIDLQYLKKIKKFVKDNFKEESDYSDLYGSLNMSNEFEGEVSSILGYDAEDKGIDYEGEM